MEVWAVVILFIIYSYFDGDIDGDYWEMLKSRLGQLQTIGLMDSHAYLFTRRVLVSVMCSVGLYGITAYAFLFSLCLGLIFSLFHNGAYYLRRNELNPNIYRSKFFASSETSTSIMEFNFYERLILFIIGIIGIVLIQIYG